MNPINIIKVKYEHITSEHNQNKPIKCNICNVAFPRINYLKADINSVHDQNKPIKCDVCTVAFLRNTYLKVHIKSVHEQNKHYKSKI